jgi:hypothetical protein
MSSLVGKKAGPRKRSSKLSAAAFHKKVQNKFLCCCRIILSLPPSLSLSLVMFLLALKTQVSLSASSSVYASSFFVIGSRRRRKGWTQKIESHPPDADVTQVHA